MSSVLYKRMDEDGTTQEIGPFLERPVPSPVHAQNKDRDPYTLNQHELLAELVILLREIKARFDSGGLAR